MLHFGTGDADDTGTTGDTADMTDATPVATDGDAGIPLRLTVTIADTGCVSDF